MHDSIEDYMNRHHTTVGAHSEPTVVAMKAIGDVLIDLRKSVDGVQQSIERERPERYEWDVIPVAAADIEGRSGETLEEALARGLEEEAGTLIGGKTDEGWTFVDVCPWGDTSALFVFRRER